MHSLNQICGKNLLSGSNYHLTPNLNNLVSQFDWGGDSIVPQIQHAQNESDSMKNITDAPKMI